MPTCGLHGIIGNKGAGKSMLMTKTVTKTLLDTQRTVITNLPLLWTELLEYLRERDGSWTNERLLARVWIIEDVKEIRRFWLHRGQGWCLLDVPNERWDTGQVTDYTTCYRWRHTVDTVKRKKVPDLTPQEAATFVESGDLEMCEFTALPPVQYVWDEMQNVYPARAWQKTPPSLLWHLTQQRKVSDDIIVASQRPKLMEVQFRELMDDWLFLTNWGKKRKWIFRLPSAMSWSMYDQLPMPGVRPMVSGHAAIDVSGIGKLYDTSAGTNILGGMLADTKETGAGLNWKWAIPLLLLIIAVGWKAPGAILGFIGSKTRSVTHNMTHTTVKTNAPGTAPVSVTAGISLPGIPLPQFQAEKPVQVAPAGAYRETKPQRPRRILTGIFVWGGFARVFFSDGSSVTSGDPGWQRLIKRGDRYEGCEVDGFTYFLGQAIDYSSTSKNREIMAYSPAVGKQPEN